MLFLEGISSFIIGVFFGSFLGVLVDRIHIGESIVKGRSHCDFCKKELSPLDLIPLLSFIYLNGKCRYCKHKLSLHYPLIELTTGLFFAFNAFYFLSNSFDLQSLINFLFGVTISCGAIIVFFTDLRFGIIPDKILMALFILSLIFMLSKAPGSILIHILSAVFGGGFFLLIFLLTRGKGMGFGDVKFSFLIGFILGFPSFVLSFYLAFLTGATLSIILILWGKKRLRSDTIPFGPFLTLGFLIAFYFSNQITGRLLPFLLF